MLSCTLQLYLHLNTSQITQFAPCKPGEFAILAPKHISNIICRRNPRPDTDTEFRLQLHPCTCKVITKSSSLTPPQTLLPPAPSIFHLQGLSFRSPSSPRGVFPRLTSQIVRELGGFSPGPWFAVALQACKVALQNRSTAFFACSLTPS